MENGDAKWMSFPNRMYFYFEFTSIDVGRRKCEKFFICIACYDWNIFQEDGSKSIILYVALMFEKPLEMNEKKLFMNAKKME